MGVPVLAYHAANVNGVDYATNDHVALGEDLLVLGRLGYRIAPLAQVVRMLLSGLPLPERTVAITMDDGTVLDYRDVDHPKYGRIPGMHRIMADYYCRIGYLSQPTLHATSFVIVSPDAREQLDRRSLSGLHWYGDEWWAPAVASGLMGIASHSWDHNHECVDRAMASIPPGSFAGIDTPALAEHQIAQSVRFVRAAAPSDDDRLFAYPYGEANSYLVDKYLPRFGDAIGLLAAFTTEPAPVAAGCNRWSLPRFVCGAAWTSPDGLVRVLEECG